MNNDTPKPAAKDSLTAKKPRCPMPVHTLSKNSTHIVFLHEIGTFYEIFSNIEEMGDCFDDEKINYFFYDDDDDIPYTDGYCGIRNTTRKNKTTIDMSFYHFAEHDIVWTRAEALASQMLPAPDKAGVWVVESPNEIIKLDSYIFTDITQTVSPIDNLITYVSSKCGHLFVLGQSRFYYMGPLPTASAEGEVVP